MGGHDGSGALGIQLGGDGMTIGMVMDWLENRLEMVEGEEDEGGETQTQTQPTTQPRAEDRKEKTRERGARRTSPKAQPAPPPPSTTTRATPIPPPQLTNTTQPRPSSSRTLSSSPPPIKQHQPTRSRTKRNAPSSSSGFTFRAPLPVTTINPFEHDFGTQHLEPFSPSEAAQSQQQTGDENDFPSILSSEPTTSIGSKRRHSSIISESPASMSNNALNVASTSSAGRSGGQTPKRRGRGAGPSNASNHSIRMSL